MSSEFIFTLGVIVGISFTLAMFFILVNYHKKKERKFIEEILSDQPSNDLLNINDIPTYTYQHE